MAASNSSASRVSAAATAPPFKQKPKPAQKSALVLAVAREIILQKRRKNKRAFSDSDIYDDVLSLNELRRHTEDEDDIYDDTIIPDSSGRTHFQLPDDIYDDVIPMKPTSNGSATTDLQDQTSSLPQHYEIPVKSPIPETTRSGNNRLNAFRFPIKSSSIQVTSFEDIYDDIIVFRSQMSDGGVKPNVPPKSRTLYQHPRVKELLRQQREKKAMEIEEIYDTMTSEELAFVQNVNQETEEDGSGVFDEEYIDPTTLQDCSEGEQEHEKNTSASAENGVAHDQVNPACKRQNQKQQEVDYAKFGLRLLAGPVNRRKNRDKPSEPSRNRSSSDVQHTLESHSPMNKSATLPNKRHNQLQLPTSRQTHDPLPEFDSRLKRLTFIGEQPLECTTSDEEGYEDVALYEDVEQYQDEQQTQAYEDLDLTVANALGLPKKIRGRATRIEKGRKTRRLRKSVKRRIQKRNTLNPTNADSNSIPNSPSTDHKADQVNGKVNENEVCAVNKTETPSLASKSMPELTQSISSEPDVCFPSEKQTVIDQRVQTQDVAPSQKESDVATDKVESSEDDGEEESESIPFGKSREVFELLLDASNIQRIAEKSSTQRETIQPLPQASDSSSNSASSSPLIEAKHNNRSNSTKQQGYLDSTEFQRITEVARTQLKPYQEAGVLTLRPRSEIEADIKEIVENAPPTPPPLPGFQRPRARVITHTDRVLHKRVMLRRRHTLHSVPLDKQTN